MSNYSELPQVQSVTQLTDLTNLTLPDGQVSLVVLGPGNGESVLLKIPPNSFFIIDSFLRPKTTSGLCPVLDLLDSLGGTLSGAILTHPHADHAEGFDRVVGRCQGPIGIVEKFLPDPVGKWDTVALRRRGLVESALNAIKDRWETDSTTRWPLQAGETRTVGEAKITILHPDADSIANLSGLNQLSSPVLLEWNSLRIVLSADLPTDLWPSIDRDYALCDHHGMKVPHHASKEGFNPSIHGPGPTSRFWVATPYKRMPQPPSFEDGQGVDLILQHVDHLHLTSVLFATPDILPDPVPRTRLLELAKQKNRTINLPGTPVGVPIANPKDPNSAWIATSWTKEGTLSSLQRGRASVRVCAN